LSPSARAGSLLSTTYTGSISLVTSNSIYSYYTGLNGRVESILSTRLSVLIYSLLSITYWGLLSVTSVIPREASGMSN